ncbi:hypothetical protein SAY86_028659 [Trapa natans]|uniref:DNA replication complex GINS protein SLD5 n=1 Tax=Trapa natans TaxID=22666 RepID=A0AAN7LVC1_TRANT|nr:hypothetical protein SAY86_028659 [Trapa natans]
MTSSSSDPVDNFGTLSDVEPLKRAWRNEKAAPEILRFEEQLINRVSEQIQLMEETVDHFTEKGTDPLTVSLYQMDLDRTQFLLRSYLRIRLQKIEKCMFHVLNKTELYERLSEQEKIFVQRSAEDFKKHLDESVLLHLPDNYQSILKQFTASQEDKDGKEDGMVPEPPLDTFVVCKARDYIGPSEFQGNSNDSLTMDLPLEMERDDLSFIPYRRIQKLLDIGKVDLV